MSHNIVNYNKSRKFNTFLELYNPTIYEASTFPFEFHRTSDVGRRVYQHCTICREGQIPSCDNNSM